MHGSLQCLKISYIHNCWNPSFVPEPLWNSDNPKFSNFKIDFFYRSVISPFAVQLFLLPFILIAQRKISVLTTHHQTFATKLRYLRSSTFHRAPFFTGDILIATDWLERLCRHLKIRSRGMTQYQEKGHFVRKTPSCSWCNGYV